MQLKDQDIRLIGALKHDPGYLLLCDLLQARADDLTDELANPNLPSHIVEAKLRFWQAFRSILADLKTAPENFAEQADPAKPEEEIVLDQDVFSRLQTTAYRRMLEEGPLTP